MSFFGHLESVACGLFSHDGKYLITGSEDITAKIWELKNQKLSLTVKGNGFHKAEICSMAVAKAKSIFATGSVENELAVTNYDSGNVVLCITAGETNHAIEAIAFCNE